jgi:hypothetical protein
VGTRLKQALMYLSYADENCLETSREFPEIFLIKHPCVPSTRLLDSAGPFL